MSLPTKPKVLIAGIGGGSLGAELLKCLHLAGRYEIFGADISPMAFGHYMGFADHTFVPRLERYIDDLMDYCSRHRIQAIIPGGEEPMVALHKNRSRFESTGIHLAMNSNLVTDWCSHKDLCFSRLKALGSPAPKTLAIAPHSDYEDTKEIPYPCIVKPATGTGGSAFVSLVSSVTELQIALKSIHETGRAAILQEYLPLDEGEFTIGVLSYPDGRIAGSVAMKRGFYSKLSIAMKSSVGLISSGYSQGLIKDFPDLRRQAESIALSLGSIGPLNLQGRVRDGCLIPFEINPRFSASTYLRALAGFNETDYYLGYLFFGETETSYQLKEGYYLRSFTETYVPEECIL